MNRNYKTLSKEEVKNFLKDEDTILLDVRTEDEYYENSLEGTINIPLHELKDRILELDKNKTYITFCRSGVRSKSAVLILLEENFENVYNSEEGILTWEDRVKYL